MENGNSYGILDNIINPAMLGLVCQQGRNHITASGSPSLQAWKLLHNEISNYKFFKDLLKTSGSNSHKLQNGWVAALLQYKTEEGEKMGAG